MTPPIDDDPGKMLARIDERTESIIRELESIKSDLETKYVTKAEFQPVQRIVYGAVGVALLALAGAILGLILH